MLPPPTRSLLRSLEGLKFSAENQKGALKALRRPLGEAGKAAGGAKMVVPAPAGVKPWSICSPSNLSTPVPSPWPSDPCVSCAQPMQIYPTGPGSGVGKPAQLLELASLTLKSTQMYLIACLRHLQVSTSNLAVLTQGLGLRPKRHFSHFGGI